MLGNGLGEVMGASITLLANPLVWISLLIFRELNASAIYGLAIGVQLLSVIVLIVFAAIGGGDVFAAPYAYFPPAIQALIAALISGAVVATVFLGLRRAMGKRGKRPPPSEL